MSSLYALLHERIADLEGRLRAAEASADRLRAERNALVMSTDLGKLSEQLEEDNWASGAKIVRHAMHRIDVLETHLRAVIGEADFVLRGGDDPLDRCGECELAGVGMLRDALAAARGLVAPKR